MPSETGFGKKKMNIRATILVGSLFVLSAMSMAAESVHLYLKTSGQGHIAGASQLKSHGKWIEVVSWQCGRDAMSGMATGRTHPTWTEVPDVLSPRDPASAQSTGKRMHKPFHFTIELDRAGMQIVQALAGGETIIECMVAITGDDGKTETATLSGATLGHILLQPSQNGSRPHETITFEYGEITWK